MYRLIFVIALCLMTASSAPQSKESEVTYVKIQPVVEDRPVAAASNIRESRIEKLPLTIPGNVSKSDSKDPAINPTTNSNKKVALSDSSEIKSDLSKNSSNVSAIKKDLAENLDLSESIQSDVGETVDSETNATEDLSEINPTEDDLSESNSEILSDTVPSETSQSDRRARNFDSVETTETTDEVTEKYEDELFDHTAIEAPRTRTPPKFVPKGPKLSYLQKSRVFQSYSSPNQLENASKRRFRSRCSCQKIWNCPKLQITVPRCPDEYFLCCF